MDSARRQLEVTVSAIALVPLRFGLPDILQIMDAIDQVGAWYSLVCSFGQIIVTDDCWHQANKALSRGFSAVSAENDVARDDWHRTTRDAHVRQLLRHTLENTVDRVYVKCIIRFGAIVVGPALSMRPMSTAHRQPGAQAASALLYVLSGNSCVCRSSIHQLTPLLAFQPGSVSPRNILRL